MPLLEFLVIKQTCACYMSQAYNDRRQQSTPLPPYTFCQIMISVMKKNKQCHMVGGEERTTSDWSVKSSMRKCCLNWNLKDKIKYLGEEVGKKYARQSDA